MARHALGRTDPSALLKVKVRPYMRKGHASGLGVRRKGQFQERMRGNNLNALKRIEGEEVGVTGDNVGREAIDGKFEKLVVLRITASSYSHIDIDPLSLARQSREKTRISASSRYRRMRFLLRTSWSSASVARESRTFPAWSAKLRALRGFESGRSNALTRTLLSKTQRN